jgi:hypothetical protein
VLRVTGKKGLEHIEEFGSRNAEVGKKTLDCVFEKREKFCLLEIERAEDGKKEFRFISSDFPIPPSEFQILPLFKSVAIPVYPPKCLDHRLLPIPSDNLNDIFQKLILVFFVPNNIGPPAAKILICHSSWILRHYQFYEAIPDR